MNVEILRKVAEKWKRQNLVAAEPASGEMRGICRSEKKLFNWRPAGGSELFSVSVNQHSKILGFALAAYGFQHFSRAVKSGRTLFNEFFYSDSSPLYVLLTLPLDPVFGQFWHFLIPVLAGLAILWFSGKGRFFSLLFVLTALGNFPLGTILSFYTLYYLFVVGGEREFAPNLSEKTS